MKLSALFRRTLIGQTLLFGLVVGTLSLVSAYSLRWYLAGEYSSRGSAIARSVAGIRTRLTLPEDLAVLQELLLEFQDLQGVAYVFVADPDGTLVAHTFEQGIPTAFQAPGFRPHVRPVDSRDRPYLRRFLHSPNWEGHQTTLEVDYLNLPNIGYVINLTLPIEAGNLGYVYVGLDQVRMIRQIRAAALVNLWVTLGLFGLSVAITYGMVQRISQPLNQLTAYAKQLANRNFSATVAIHSRDEIGLLADTLRGMALDIQVFIGQLEDTLAELQKTQAQLIQTEKMSSLGQLVAGVAHEINNPISFIAGNLNYAQEYADTLMAYVKSCRYPGRVVDRADGYPLALPSALSCHQAGANSVDAVNVSAVDVVGEPITEAGEEVADLAFIMADFPKVLQSMRLGADRIRAIVQSLRNFSRLDEAELKPVDIHEGLESTLLILGSRIKHPSHCDPVEIVRVYGDLPQVECYAGLLNQVFMNLLANALDALDTPHSNPHPRITLETDSKDGKVMIAIQDNGSGVSPELGDRLFDPFFTTKSVGQGTGLGLAICYQIIVERHRGHIEYDSTPGQGTTFTVTIPVRQP